MKVIKRVNIRVEVTPELWSFGSEPSEEARLTVCERLVSQIKRHVDEIESVLVLYDTKETCSLCGLPWEVSPAGSVDYPEGYPWCCEEAQEEFQLTQKVKA